MYKVNLLPPELVATEPGVSRRSPLYNLLVFCVGGLCLLYVAFLLYLFFSQLQVQQKQKALAALEPQIQQVERLQQQSQALRDRAMVWEGILKERREYYPLLVDLQRVLPVDMWLTRIELGAQPQAPGGLPAAPAQPQASGGAPPPLQPAIPPAPNRLVIEGGTRSLSSVGVYINNLCRLPYLQKVTLREVTTVGQDHVTTFTIEAVLGGK
ncbi:type IV pilus assembly protein PilN [Thermodesulfitimonas autotrophica]|uniref:Type IV pilus assembly protein PilN n=1 Tax=Thermodesulfitimonas autotrophica TaxID=1894989 RepID=A0A3N5AW20_9THEO|nr:PilN domain-containing protein [Thermodesulfitimonas autotrophica]RPF49229.1 type IV pilus assembly protein PilN [Thermodesulfitimonas autotrophica]